MCEADYRAHLNHKLEIARKFMTANGLQRLVIHSGSIQDYFRDDLSYPFKANPYFLEWVPYPEADSFLAIDDSGGRPELYVLETPDYWHSPANPPEASVGFCLDVRTYSNRVNLMKRLFRGAKTALITNSDQTRNWPNNLSVNPDDLLELFDEHRPGKTKWEVECIAQANRKAVQAHHRARDLFHMGASELEIHLGYLETLKVMDHELPYGNIVAVNEHAAILHHWRLSNQRPAKPLSLLIDAGATCDGYAADITRSYTTDTGLFADLLDGMEKLQQRATGRVSAGVSFAELHEEAFRDIGRLLKESGLISIGTEHADFIRVVSSFFPHGLGHYVGIQVHDKGGQFAANSHDLEIANTHPNLRLTRTLDIGQVVTIEPGLYFIPGLLEALDATPAGKHVNWPLVELLKPFGGIRIEDNLLVEAAGSRNLTREAFLSCGSGKETQQPHTSLQILTNEQQGK